MNQYNQKEFVSIYDYNLNRMTNNYQYAITFHFELAEKYGRDSILEIGCGTGNILLPLLQKGYEIDGLDISEKMLAVLKKKLKNSKNNYKPQIKCSNMTNFRINKKYGLIIMPYDPFIFLLTSKDQIKALKNINKHLLPNGIVSFNFFLPDYIDIYNILQKKIGKNVLLDTFDLANGNLVNVYIDKISCDIRKQIITLHGSQEEVKNNKIIYKIEHVHKTRWTNLFEMEYLMQIAGFKIIKTYNNYKKEKNKNSCMVIVIAKKL